MEKYDFTETLNIPIPLDQAQSLIEEEIDKYSAKLHFPEYNQCTIVANEGKSTYKMIIYMYDAATNNTQCVGSNLKPLVKDPVDEYTIFDKDLPAEKVVSDKPRTVSDDSAKLQSMKYSEAIILTIDVQGDNMTKISSLFHTSPGYNFGGYQYNRRSKIVYSTLTPQPCLNFTNNLGKTNKAVKALQQAAHSRFGLVLRNEVNPFMCNGSRYFFYYKDMRFGGIPDKYKGERCVFTFNGFDRFADPTVPQGGDRPYLDNGQVWMFKDGAWKFYTNTSSLYYAGSLKEEDYVQCYTNGQLLADYYSYPTQLGYFHIKPSFKNYPYEIGDVGYTDKDCEGKPVEPGTTPDFPSGKFPFEETLYLKYGFTQTKNLEECITFTSFQAKGEDNRSFYLRGHEGKYLPYKKEEGCWHQYPLRPDSEIFNIVYKKDPVTNSKELYDFLQKRKEYDGELRYVEGFPKAQYESQFWSSSKGLYYIKFQEKSEVGDTIVIAFNRAEGTVVKEIRGGWRLKNEGNWRTEWKPEFDPKAWPTEYQLNQGKDYYRGFRTNHKLLFNQLKRENMLNDAAQFISPCTDPTPDGQLPPGIAGPNQPPKPKPPGAGGNDPFGPPAPQPPDPSKEINDSSITCSKDEDYSYTNINNKLNGLYFYYLEQGLFNSTPNKDNTSILGTTEAICNVAYVPFLNISPDQLCRIPFDVKRYGEYEGAGVPNVYRISMNAPKEMHIASWNVYPTNAVRGTHPGTPWKYTMESRLLDYPYRRCVFYSNVFDAYEVIPHLHYQSSGDLKMELKTCCAVTPGGNFYAYVKGYKNDAEGFIERQFSNASMDIPNTSNAYSNYMSSQKAQASVAVQQSALSSLGSAVPTIAPTMLAAAAIPGVNIAMVGAAAITAAVGSGATSTLQTMQQNMAYRQDLMTTPKSLKSMGGDVIARLGCANKATVISCDMVITDMYKDMLARFFQMYGTKQNRVLDVQANINSRYYYNYIKTIGCNISSNGVPKKHVATIKAIMDKGTTFWHLDREGVNYGEYCVYDNCEI